MRKLAPLFFVCLASVALAADTKETKPPTPADQETAPPSEAEPGPDEAATDAEDPESADAEGPGDDEKLFAQLEAAAAAAAQEERERAAKVAAERAAAKGEKHDTFTTAKGRVYNKVLIRAVDDLGVRIMHEAGTARIPFAECPQEFQKRFGYDPEAAEAQATKEKLRESERTRRAIARLRAESGLPPSKTQRKIPTTTARTTPKTKPIPTTTPDEPSEPGEAPDLDLTEGADGEVLDIPTLEKKIATLEAGIAKIKKIGDGYEDKAKKIEERLFKTNSGNTELSPEKMKVVKEWRDKADAEYDKIAAARRLINKHRKTIRKIERSK